VLEANDAYWGPPPGIKTLRFKDIPELAARVTALITGEIDFTFGLPPDQLATLQGNADLQQAAVPAYRYYFIWMNATRPPFDDVRVRQAMTYALDVDAMVKNLLQGLAQRMQAPIPSTVFGTAPQTPYAYDPARAKQLLADAGLANGFSATMIWNPNSGPQDREIAQSLLSYWNAIGVRIQDGQAERAQWLDKLLKLDWDLDLQTNGVTTVDADFVLRRLYTTRANRTGYSNADLDKILDDAAQTADQDRRKALYAQANHTLWDQAVGIYPFELVVTYVSRKAIQGFVPTPGIPTFGSVTVRR
jgi:peptide/nickel transport system substrate-binding protein